MAGSLPDLVARVRLDTSDLEQSVGRATKVGSAIGSALGNLASGGIASALSGVKTFASGSVDAFAAVEDATGAAGVQFGDTLPSVLAFADKAAASFGISKRGALDAANTFGTLGKSAGLSGTDLSGFANQFTGLAGDLASFKGTSPEQAIEAIGAALRGEAEPIRAYGVLLDDASLRQEALAQGLITTTKDALTPQQKVLATQALILKQVGDAQGDFARTSDSTANTQKRLASETENAQAILGAKLAPAITVVREAFLGMIQGSTGVIDKLGAVADKVQPIVQAVAAGLQPALEAIVAKLQEFAAAIPMPVITALGVALGVVATALAAQAIATAALTAVTTAASVVTGLFAVTINAETGAVQRGIVARVAHNVAVVASTAAQLVATAATAAWTAGVWLMNAALAANPIGLVVLALVALVAGLVIAYKNSETFRAAVDKAFGAVKAAAKTLADFVTVTIPAAFQVVKDKVTSIGAAIVGALAATWASVKSGVTGAWEAVKSSTTSAWEAVKRAVTTGVGAVVGFIRELPGKAVSALASLGSAIGGVATSALRTFATNVTTGIGVVLELARGIPGRMVSALGSLGGTLAGAGRELIAGLVRGITDKLAAVREVMGKVAGAIKGFLPGSPVKTGPLKSWNRGAAGTRLMDLLASGIDGKPVQRALTRALDVDLPTPGTLSLSAAGLARATAANTAAAAPAWGEQPYADGQSFQETVAPLLAELRELRSEVRRLPDRHLQNVRAGSGGR